MMSLQFAQKILSFFFFVKGNKPRRILWSSESLYNNETHLLSVEIVQGIIRALLRFFFLYGHSQYIRILMVSKLGTLFFWDRWNTTQFYYN